jgi:mannose/fructose/N-acetylgalactosamine-specific phosphotransferase system component IIC
VIASAFAPVLTGAPWELVGWLALLAGCLALDETSVAQTWLSQPLPAALLAGVVCGEPAAGVALGLPLQLALTMNLPVGQTLTGDIPGAAIAAVGGAALAGVVPGPLTGGGDAGLTGWLLLGAALVSLAGHPFVQGERRLHLVWMLRGRHTLRDGDLGRIERIHGLCLLATFSCAARSAARWDCSRSPSCGCRRTQRCRPAGAGTWPGCRGWPRRWGWGPCSNATA